MFSVAFIVFIDQVFYVLCVLLKGIKTHLTLASFKKVALKTDNYMYVRTICISAPNRQNKVRLIFGKNELGAFSESLRPPQSIAGSIMTLAGL